MKVGSSGAAPLLQPKTKEVNKLSKVIAEQPIRYYAAPSMDYKGRKHPFVALLEEHPGDWSRGMHFPRYCMAIDLEIKSDLPFGEEQIIALNEEINRLVADLPDDFRQSYQYLIDESDNPEIGIPRAVEFLTLASCRYVLDCIRRDLPDGKEVSLQGVVPPTAEDTRELFQHSRIMICHNHGKELDPLLSECLALAVEKVRLIIAGEPMTFCLSCGENAANSTPRSSSPDAPALSGGVSSYLDRQKAIC